MLEVSDIAYFTQVDGIGRSLNDYSNKIRENIIKNIRNINEKFENDSQYGDDWINLQINFNRAMKKICSEWSSYKIEQKAGRKYNYDFHVVFYNKSGEEIDDAKLEFKFNATCIDDVPQFVSPMKPSQYLSQSFEDYYYDNYLVNLLQDYELQIPEKNVYLSKIHSNKPKCMENAQKKYYQGCQRSSKFTGKHNDIEFYEKCINISKECIEKFIEETDLNISKLSDYLINSQNNKIYLLYKNNKFNIQSIEDDYTIVSYEKQPKNFRYVATTKSGKTINILLRWKNGNGIAYPAFQIS